MWENLSPQSLTNRHSWGSRAALRSCHRSMSSVRLDTRKGPMSLDLPNSCLPVNTTRCDIYDSIVVDVSATVKRQICNDAVDIVTCTGVTRVCRSGTTHIRFLSQDLLGCASESCKLKCTNKCSLFLDLGKGCLT